MSSDIYAQALAIIRRDGWRKGGRGWDGEATCLAGAILRVTHPHLQQIDDLTDEDPAWRPVREAASAADEMFPGRTGAEIAAEYADAVRWHPYTLAWHFNDHDDTTQEDVELVLKHLAG